MINKAVILAAGLGTRFYPITKEFPKEMLPVIDKPIIHYLLEELIKSDIKEVAIVINKDKEMIKKYFDLSDTSRIIGKEYLVDEIKYINDNIKITYLYQDKMLGTAYAINLAKDFVANEPFVIMYGDDFIISVTPVVKQMIDIYNKTKMNVLGVKEVDKNTVNRYGVMEYENQKNGKIKAVVEKPNIEDAPSCDVSTGRILVNPEVFEEIKKLELKKGEYIFTGAMTNLMETQEFYACKYEGNYFDIGNKTEYIKTIIYTAMKSELYQKDIEEYIKQLVNN